VNDLQFALSTTPRLFADDKCIVIKSPDFSELESKCNLELANLKNWCDSNKIQLNLSKSVVMTIAFKLNIQADLCINYDEDVIACQDSCKYLGVYRYSKLNF